MLRPLWPLLLINCAPTDASQDYWPPVLPPPEWPTEHVQTFVQTGHDAVDILLVVDNTPGAIRAAVGLLRDWHLARVYLDNIDFRLALADVVSHPDRGDAPLAVHEGVPYIDDGAANPTLALTALVATLRACDPEAHPSTGFDAVLDAVDPTHGFRRPDVYLFSDRDDGSSVDAATFALQRQGDGFSTTVPHSSERYLEAQSIVGGYPPPDVDDLARRASGLRIEFHLDRMPDFDTLAVDVRPSDPDEPGQQVPFAYHATRNSVFLRFPDTHSYDLLGHAPSSGSRVRVAYEPRDSPPLRH